MARVIARRSLCDRDQVGAVIASQEDRVVAVGYNGPPAGFRHEGRSCLAWCPRARESMKVVGYEQRGDSPWNARHRITEWGGTFEDQYITVDDTVRYHLSDLTEPQRIELMRECGFEAVYGGDDASYANCPSLHAEANALSVCDRVQRELGTIYVTSIPCMDCAKLIANSGLTRLVYRLTPRGKAREDRLDESPLAFLANCGIKVKQL